MPWLKPGVLTGALLPLALLGWRAVHHTLGVDAVAVALNQLGLLALTFLTASLAPTPLKILTGWTWPIRLRRMLGLLAVFHAALHFSLYVAVDQGFDWRVIWQDIAQRKFILVGFSAFLLLLPLAATSTNASVRWLGFPRWKALHRLAYVAAVLAVIHFVWRVKRDVTVPALYGTAVGALLLVRILEAARARPRTRPQPAPGSGRAG